MALHLSQLLFFVLPAIGAIGPIVLWIIGKDKSTMVDQQGKIVLNWIISFFVYFVISCFLCVLFVGVMFILVVVVLNVVFIIFGAVRANEGITWKYPLSIPFFK